MNIRRTVVAAGLCLSLLTAGCAGAVSGQARIASGAVLPATSESAPSPFPDPTSSAGSGRESTSSDESTGDSPTSNSTTGESSTAITENTPTDATGSGSDDPSDSSSSAPSIPGLSKDCSAVLAGITAFSTMLQGGGSGGTISQATVDKALEQLPESGLPSRPQADITVLRTVVSGAVGKTQSQLGVSMINGKVVEALQDLSNWTQTNC